MKLKFLGKSWAEILYQIQINALSISWFPLAFLHELTSAMLWRIMEYDTLRFDWLIVVTYTIMKYKTWVCEYYNCNFIL